MKYKTSKANVNTFFTFKTSEDLTKQIRLFIDQGERTQIR